MSSSRPYITRALYDWLLDNDHTPYIVVDATRENVVVPTQFVQNGQIVLNITPTAVRDLRIENAMISFNARFSGEPMEVWVPIEALMAIYSRETGAGMAFGQEPVLPDAEVEEEQGPSLESVPGKSDEEASSETTGEGKKDDDKKRKRPSLRVIK
ncbi:ClpXP protease specificity-enhancing factor [Carnimonas nigrificans]|uniref:ClpXP protease specificity-enhancing factor n=1 Tax=Carnimonas nigrificans TaxID=64323 RepID=UPI000472D924|nr:ClpXP protease specificity-enhancing factor [Carnimonas nigrificans]